MIEYIERESKRNKINKELISELKKISNDIEFIYGVLLYAEHEEDRKSLLEYIKKGEEVNFEQIILTSLWLSQQRENL